MKKFKILAIQFKYLGDAVFITPALFALRTQYPDSEIHLLVSNQVAPLFKHIEWIDKVWEIPHKRGKSNFSASSKIVIQLHREHFDKSVDFVGNDRGSILSLLIQAKHRLAATNTNPKILQKLAYTDKVCTDQLPISWIDRHLEMLFKAWNIPIPSNPKMFISSNSNLIHDAKAALQGQTIICHIGTSQPKKEWPIKKWHEFHKIATAAGYKVVFSSGPNIRERQLLTNLQHLSPEILILPTTLDIELFLAILKASQLVIVGDTGPLHFAAALGTKVIGLFGTADSVNRAAPIYSKQQLAIGRPCTCIKNLAKSNTCNSTKHCMDSITPQQVLDILYKQLPL
jgi:heptosyltransferase-3